MKYYVDLDPKLNDLNAMENHQALHKVDSVLLKVAALNSILEMRGVRESFDLGYPINKNIPQPLLTFTFLDWFQSYDFKNHTLVEIGSGGSTFFFSTFFNRIKSYETNIDFYNFMLSKNLPQNVEYNYIPVEELYKNKFNFDSRDIVLVDCDANRYVVIERILESGFDGILILDNTDAYPNSVNLLNKNRFYEIPFWGFKLTESFESCTSVFIKDVSLLPKRNYEFKSLGSRNFTANDNDKKYA
jgi:hypothetical protein